MWLASLVLVLLLLPATGSIRPKDVEHERIYGNNQQWGAPATSNPVSKLKYFRGLVTEQEMAKICPIVIPPASTSSETTTTVLTVPSTTTAEATTSAVLPTWISTVVPTGDFFTTSAVLPTTAVLPTWISTVVSTGDFLTAANPLPNDQSSTETTKIVKGSPVISNTTTVTPTNSTVLSSSTVPITTTTTTTKPTTTTTRITIAPVVPVQSTTRKTTTTEDQEEESVLNRETNQQSGDDKGESKGSGLYIGIAIGLIVLVIVIVAAVIIVLVLRKKRNKMNQKKVVEKKSPGGAVPEVAQTVTQETSQPPSHSSNLGGGKPHAKRKPINKKIIEKSQEEPEQPELEPKNMDHGKVDKTNFMFMGPLTLEAGQEGPVRHAMEGVKSSSLKQPIQFDITMNKVYDIGSEIEKLQTDKLTSNSVVLTEDDNTLVLNVQKGGSQIEKPKSKKGN